MKLVGTAVLVAFTAGLSRRQRRSGVMHGEQREARLRLRSSRPYPPSQQKPSDTMRGTSVMDGTCVHWT